MIGSSSPDRRWTLSFTTASRPALEPT